MDNIKLIYSKQAKKYLEKTDRNTYNKLNKAIQGLKSYPFMQGNIERLKGYDNKVFKLKIEHYRILFEIYKENREIHIIEIGVRGDIYK